MIQGMEKKQLRRALVAQRSGMDAAQRESCSRMACERLLQSALWKRASGVLLTVSTPQELDTMPLLQAALGQGKPLFLPKCSGKKMSFYLLLELSDLRRGAFGLWEPPDETPLVPAPGLLLVAPAVTRKRVVPKNVFIRSATSSINGTPKISVPNCGIFIMPGYIKERVSAYFR